MIKKDFPQTELQEKIYSFWSARGWDKVTAVLGNLNVAFHRNNPKYDELGICYQYLEQFWNKAQMEKEQEVQELKELAWKNISGYKELIEKLQKENESWKNNFESIRKNLVSVNDDNLKLLKENEELKKDLKCAECDYDGCDEEYYKKCRGI